MPKLQTVFDWSMLVQILRSEHFLAWTQERLARELGVSVFSVSKWERGEVAPMPKHRDSLKRLALAEGFPREEWPRKGLTGPRALSRDLPQESKSHSPEAPSATGTLGGASGSVAEGEN